MVTERKKINKIRICLLGASFETGNLGVNALAESSIKVILNRWPDAEIVFFGSGFVPGQNCMSVAGREITAQLLPVRFSKNIFLPYHFFWFVLYGLLIRLLPGSRAKALMSGCNQYVRMLYETDLAVDITGGDSFSDIYGFKRFLLGTLRKWLVILFDKRLIMLPQTYGPFKHSITRAMARHILNRASLVYSRDLAGMEYVHKLLGNYRNGKVRFSSDVAFVLDARRPENLDIEPNADLLTKHSIMVGLNISGLLFNGNRGDMFDLRTDYRRLVFDIIEMLVKYENVGILLIPHVFPQDGSDFESDPDAASQVFREVSEKHRNRVFLVRGKYDQNEIKYIIGKCDFVIGSRMHACIAALSQGIPAVGLAYSKKFYGVFESVGVEDMVIDMRQHNKNEILEAVRNVFEKRKNVSEHLHRTIPDVQAKILNMFDDVEL